MKNGRGFLYTDDQEKFILDNRHMERSRLAELFNSVFKTDLTTKAMRRKCERLGALCGRTGRFEEGNAYKDPLPVGSERLIGSRYVQIKIDHPPYWVSKGRYVWEKENGNIPEGCVLTYKDGDPINCGDIENLAVITKAERSAINSMGLNKLPPELFDTALLLARITMKSNERVRNER